MKRDSKKVSIWCVDRDCIHNDYSTNTCTYVGITIANGQCINKVDNKVNCKAAKQLKK